MLVAIISNTRFKCPVSGLITKAGEVCAEDEFGNKLHINQMPARRLRPLPASPTLPLQGEKISPCTMIKQNLKHV